MRLDFNVLWVEDQPGAVASQARKLDRLVREDGFRLQTKFATSVAAAMAFIDDDVYSDHVDLVLIDNTLGPGPHGDEGIVQIRETLPYKDIIFYSAGAGDLRALREKSGADGVYLSSREDLPDRAAGLFRALIKKVIDIDHSRGIVMGAASDIDQHVHDCLVAVFDQCDSKQQASILGLVLDRAAQIEARFAKEIQALKSISHLADLFDLHGIYTSVDRLNLLRKILKARTDLNSSLDGMKAYVTDVIPRRNVLAHVKVHRNGFSRKLIDRDGNELTAEHMRELRSLMLDHQELFEKLVSGLVTPSSPSS